MNYFRKYNSYNLNHGYNPRITDIVPDNSSDDLKLRRLSSFRQNNAHSTPQQQQQYQPLLSSSSFREQSNKILDKWRQTNSGNQKPTDDSTRPVQTQQTNFVLNLDQIMEKDLANQLKKLEIKPKPKIDLVTIRFTLYKIKLRPSSSFFLLLDNIYC